jgi:hypothetical protein
MSCPSHEQLLGYVLGALEPREHEQLERELAKDPELALQVAALSARLQPLECCRETEAPPHGLATRTCAAVFAHAEEFEKVTPARHGVAAAMSAEYGEANSQWSLADLVVAAGIFMAAGMLFFPAIANSRYMAQRGQCQNNQRLLGEAIQQASNFHPQMNLMNVANLPADQAVAGIQPMMLKEHGLLPRDNVVLCPASPQGQRREAPTIGTLSDYQQATRVQQRDMARDAAGSYAWQLGHRDDDDAAENVASEFIAIAADAPSGVLPNLVSTHHDGRGQNVLFASGRTVYICGCGDADCGDSLFWNRDLKIEAGLDARDNVVAGGGTYSFAMPVMSFDNN